VNEVPEVLATSSRLRRRDEKSQTCPYEVESDPYSVWGLPYPVQVLGASCASDCFGRSSRTLVIRLGKVKPKSRPLRFRGFRAKYFSFRGSDHDGPHPSSASARLSHYDYEAMNARFYTVRAYVACAALLLLMLPQRPLPAAAPAAAAAAVAIFIRWRRRIRCYFFSEYLRNYLTDLDAVFTAGKGMKRRIWRSKGLNFIWFKKG